MAVRQHWVGQVPGLHVFYADGADELCTRNRHWRQNLMQANLTTKNVSAVC